MKTTEIDGKTYTANTNQDGSITLTPVIEEKPERKPRCGDVHLADNGRGFYVRTGVLIEEWYYSCFDGCMVETARPIDSVFLLNVQDFVNGDYVLKSDVVAALSFEDTEGEDLLHAIKTLSYYGAPKTRETLEALGIELNA